MNIEQRRQLADDFPWYPNRTSTSQIVAALRATLDDLERAEAQIVTLFAATAHGDEEHRRWLQDKIANHFTHTYPAAERLLARLRAAEAVCEATTSIVTKGGVRQELSAYVMGVEMIARVEAWRRACGEGT